MGRTDEVQFLRECVAAWQRYGARVTFQPGWEARGNGDEANYEGCIVHHTAFVSSAANPNPALNTLINGRPDLAGPLCNATAPWADSPWLHVIAAYPANHAGASGGKSMGPLPVTKLFNPRVLGLEIDYAGVTPMSGGQYRAALIFARGVCDVLGRSTEYARAHAETSITGKWDPGYALGKTLDMAVFRRDAASLTAGGFLMALSDAEQGELLSNSRQIRDYLGAQGGGNTKTENTVGYKVNDIQAALTHALPILLADAAQADGSDPQAVAAAVAAAVPADLAQKVVDLLGARIANSEKA